MKVYGLPKELPAPEVNYANYDHATEQKKEAEHMEMLKAWLVDCGYTGERTGGIVSFGVGDGAARYMFGEAPSGKARSILIHLPYGDAYQYPDIEYLPKKRILELIERDQKMRALFGRASRDD